MRSSPRSTTPRRRTGCRHAPVRLTCCSQRSRLGSSALATKPAHGRGIELIDGRRRHNGHISRRTRQHRDSGQSSRNAHRPGQTVPLMTHRHQTFHHQVSLAWKGATAKLGNGESGHRFMRPLWAALAVRDACGVLGPLGLAQATSDEPADRCAQFGEVPPQQTRPQSHRLADAGGG
jgi:hypothetical protein